MIERRGEATRGRGAGREFALLLLFAPLPILRGEGRGVPPSPGPALSIRKPGSPQEGLRDLARIARAFLHADPRTGDRLAPRLRKGGARAGLALLEAWKREPRPAELAPRVVDLCLELLPASASGSLRGLLPDLGPAARLRAARWFARRDLPGFLDEEGERVGALLDLVEGGGEAARAALEGLKSWNRIGVARTLFRILRKRPDRDFPRAGDRAMARTIAALSEAAPLVPEVLSWLREPGGRAFAAGLLPLCGKRPELCLEGALDPWVGSKEASIREAVDLALQEADRRLLEIQSHGERVRLWHRVHLADPTRRDALLKEFEIAVCDLGSPEEGRRVEGEVLIAELQGAEAGVGWRLRAILEHLSGEDEGPILEAGWKEARRAWFHVQPANGYPETLSGIPAFGWFAAWRRRVPPEIAERDLEARYRRFLRQGGSLERLRRMAGRERLALALLGGTLAHLDRKEEAARLWMRRALVAFHDLESLWDEDLAGPNRELDFALMMPGGARDLLTRALEGNLGTQERLPAAVRGRRLAEAEAGFLWLVDGLAAALPERVLPATGPIPAAKERERVYADLTAALLRFWSRIGEEDKALALMDRLIAALESSGVQENQQAWAGFLFERASLAMDRRDAGTAEALLKKYLAFFEARLRDVRQSPDLYADPKSASAYYAARLAAGHVSMAVLNNVVLGRLEVAREHCRKAFELEDSPFNRVLYACYLARDARSEEARALLARVDPIPAVYYNLACSLALLGEKEKALHWLALDLETNYPTRKARNRQRDWAAKDKDLLSLRGDPRFLELVRKR